MSDGLAGERVRQQGKFIALNLTPAAAVSVVMPDQVDRIRTDRGPARHLHCILHNIDFYQGAGSDQVSHDVIFKSRSQRRGNVRDRLTLRAQADFEPYRLEGSFLSNR